MDLDQFVEEVGGMGRFQWILFFVVNTVDLVKVWTVFYMTIAGYDPGWTCHIDQDDVTYPNSDVFNMTFNTSRQVEGTCDVIDSCDSVVFSQEISTLLTEWTLICDRNWILSVILSSMMIGMGIGSVVCGPLADRYGRKPSFLGWTLMLAVFNLVSYFVRDWEVFAVCRFFLGISVGALVVIRPMHIMEFTNSRWRMFLISFPFHSFANAFFSLQAYLLRDWRNLHLINALIASLGFVLLLWMPESLRWLAVQGKEAEAYSVVKRVCKYNKKPIPDRSSLNFSSSKGTKDERRGNALALFKKPLLKISILTSVCMFVVALIYLVILFGVKNLYGNFYINLAAMSMISVPFFPLLPLMGNRFGRRVGTLVLFIFSAVASLIIVVIFFSTSGSVQGMVITFMAIACSVSLDQVWTLLIIYIGELYPTSLRASCIAWAEGTTRVSGILAPYVIPRDFDTLYVSYIIAAVLCGICCLATLGLPETKGTRMQETLRQMELSRQGRTNSNKSRSLVDKGDYEAGKDNELLATQNDVA